ncbi:RNA recognition motif, partial [Trifolium medium]|nr:RNA recognition motif [Trifolium medium]
EVCGMLEDVYVPKKRNKRGEPYGFVKFSNVRDVTKLTSALNAVYFGHYRIRARVASFDRADTGTGRRPGPRRRGFIKEANDLVWSAGHINTLTQDIHRGDVDNT